LASKMSDYMCMAAATNAPPLKSKGIGQSANKTFVDFKEKELSFEQ